MSLNCVALRTSLVAAICQDFKRDPELIYIHIWLCLRYTMRGEIFFLTRVCAVGFNLQLALFSGTCESSSATRLFCPRENIFAKHDGVLRWISFAQRGLFSIAGLKIFAERLSLSFTFKKFFYESHFFEQEGRENIFTKHDGISLALWKDFFQVALEFSVYNMRKRKLRCKEKLL